MSDDIPARRLRTPEERTRYSVALVFSIVCWVVLAVTIVGAIYGVFVAAGVLVAHALMLAHLRGTGVRIGPKQLPEIWERVTRASAKLGLEQAPEVYLVQSGGVLNAFATKLLSRRFVILYSEIVDACLDARLPDGQPDELDFIIGHEIGHLAAGHLAWWLLPARIVPLLGPAYSRACEYTCDRCGHTVVGDLERSSRALAIGAAGGACAARVDLDAFCDQREEARGFWMAVYELNSTHPYTSKRVAALREFAAPGTAPAMGRNRAAYPLSPFFAFATGGASAAGLMVVALIGVMAAVAIPAFRQYMARAKAAQLRTSASAHRDDRGPIDLVAGDRFHWSLRSPGAAWQVLPNEVARKQNPLADRWLTRPELDAHILVVAEHLTRPITLDQFEQAVLTNLRHSMPSFKVSKRYTLNGGRVLKAHANTGGVEIQYEYGLFVTGGDAYQVLGFAPAANMPRAEDDVMSALSSFTAE